jgi:nucleotidyltransferase-like protein
VLKFICSQNIMTGGALSHAKEILRRASDWGAPNVGVLGSFSRGENEASSDIDFLVDLIRVELRSGGVFPGRPESWLSSTVAHRGTHLRRSEETFASSQTSIPQAAQYERTIGS